MESIKLLFEAKRFIQIINETYETYFKYGSRSPKKVDYFHSSIKDILERHFTCEKGYDIQLEYNINSCNSSKKKKCDIVVLKNKIPYIIFPVKIIMSNYKQNKNNSWENLTGELIHIKWCNPDIYIIPINILMDKTPYLNNNKEIKNFENICKQTSETIEDLEKNHNIILSNLDTNNISFRENELSIETKKIQVVNLENNISINNNELQSLSGNIKILQDNSSAPDNKLDDLENQLNEKLKIQNIKDTELKLIREKISDLSENISLLESEKSEKSLLVENLRNEISDDEKDIQGIIGQVKGIKDQLAEMGIDNISILDADINYDLSKWKKRENELTNAIERMGAINMAAIDQFKEYEERKSYLVMQKDDLLDALESLEEAIKKIDKDTKERFKETFDKVDNKLQEIFPKLFNGGKAYLKMTENDLLKTGVEVYASPPGKKLTSINLLSGGEKALTALSLVFALFSLNPSPFCMLDEVDAPLDDANIERFCNLFTEMSEKIQFIIITHKKITMEYVEQLIGVTMGEKGVSKLVNVSMQEQS